MPGGTLTPGKVPKIRLQKSDLSGISFQKNPPKTDSAHRSPLAYANLQRGIAPKIQHDPKESFVTYCILERRRNSQKHSKMLWLKNTFAMILAIDPHFQVIPYDGPTSGNAITHMNQIPDDTEQLSVYFPRFYTRGNSLTTKCKMRSSIKLNLIKRRLMPKLQNLDYWMTITQLKATRTGKVGWILGGHPELTFRSDFQTILKPLIVQKFEKDIEFQVEPETETIVLGQTRVSQRVLMVRCDINEVENIRVFFTELFSEETTFNIGYLARYRFITSHPMGICTRRHLQSILKSQQHFHKSIHFFIVYGIAHLETEFSTIQQPSSQGSPQDDQDSGAQNQPNVPEDMEIDNPQNKKVQARAEDANDPLTQEEEQEQDPPEEAAKEPSKPHADTMSLRTFLYLCQSNTNQSNLFHAIYPSTEEHKIYAVCTQVNRSEALQMLHNIEEVLPQFFHQEHISEMLVGAFGRPTHVKDYPKMTSHFRNYANALVNLVPDENPQEHEQTQELPQQSGFVSYSTIAQSHTSSTSNHTSKRSRAGELLSTSETPQPISRKSRLPQNFVADTSHQQLSATVTETIARMKNMENNQHGLKQTMDVYGEDISKMGVSIANNSKVIQANSKTIEEIKEAQSKQAESINTLAQMQGQMLSSVNSIVHFNETVIKPNFVNNPEGGRETSS